MRRLACNSDSKYDNYSSRRSQPNSLADRLACWRNILFYFPKIIILQTCLLISSGAKALRLYCPNISGNLEVHPEERRTLGRDMFSPESIADDGRQLDDAEPSAGE